MFSYFSHLFGWCWCWHWLFVWTTVCGQVSTFVNLLIEKNFTMQNVDNIFFCLFLNRPLRLVYSLLPHSKIPLPSLVLMFPKLRVECKPSQCFLFVVVFFGFEGSWHWGNWADKIQIVVLFYCSLVLLSLQ